MAQIYSPKEDSYLLEKVLKKEIPLLLEKNKDLTFLEVGAGSGIQLNAVKDLKVKLENIYSVDKNSDAVKHCQKLGFACIESDLFQNLKGNFDVIVFNPPYLPLDKRESKDSQLSTTGGKKGSEVTNKFLKNARKNLKKNGVIFVLTSSLTKGIEWGKYKKNLIDSKKIFAEELFVWKLWV